MVRVAILVALLAVAGCADFNDPSLYVPNRQGLQQNLPSNRQPEPRSSLPP